MEVALCDLHFLRYENKTLFPEPVPQGGKPQTHAAKARQAAPKAVCFAVLLSTFFVMVFVATALAALVFFLKDKKKNTRAAANTRTKTPAKKRWREAK
jgi:hypothetical protein